MKKYYLIIFAALFLGANSFGQTYHPLSSGPFLQNWSNIGLITTNDIWTGVPSIIGYRGDDITSSTGIDPQTLLGEGTVTVDVNANQTNPNTFATGGATEFHISNPVVALTGSGTADAPNLILYLNTSGVTSVRVQYNLRDIDGSIDNAVQPVALQYRIGTTGNFTNLPGGFVADASSGPDLATLVTAVDVTLPAACENQAQVQIRIITSNASGNDEWIGVDDISITGNAGADVTPPVIGSLVPADNSVDVPRNTNLVITFNESVQKGTSGNIYVKKISDNSIVQTIDILTAAVTVSGSTVTTSINILDYATAYYIEMDAAAIEDLAGNDFVGISGNSTWNFTTGNAIFIAPFNGCTSSLSDGFTQFSVIGAQVWACTSFGRDAANPPTGSAPNGVQINGFAGGTNVQNEDWLISPALNLNGTAFPLLSFWSRTRFNGAPLQLKVSTDYPGTGDPGNFTWTDLNGRFPGQTTDVWTLSQNINLSAFKTAATYIAFVYYSSIDDGARWTIDDVRIDNSPTPPPATMTVSTQDLEFGFVPLGNNGVKTFNFTGNDLAGDVTLTSTGTFLVSKTNSNFTSSITYTQAEANNLSQTVFVQFTPTAVNQLYSGTITIATPTVINVIVNTKGNSLDTAATLEVMNWNIEWFGSNSNGPSNNLLQQQNVTTIMVAAAADIYGLTEIVDETRLANVVAQMPGYAYVISNYGSHTNTSANPPSNLAEAQKLAFVYRTSVFSNVSTTALLSQGINSPADLTNPAYNYFASGRFPYMFTANATLNGVTKTVRFVLLHGKANTSPTVTSYNRRKSGSDTLQYTLNTNYPNDNIVILGDFNDDLDFTITDGIVPPITSYSAFMNDDPNFDYPTLALSLAGKKSTVSYNDVIDHVVISAEMGCSYLDPTAAILTDVTSLVANYGTTTSDHYPVFSRYLFNAGNTAAISYTGSPYCQNAGTATVTQTGTSGGTYSSTAGLTINATTGSITLASSTPGTYTVTYSVPASGPCNPAFSTTTTVTITATPNAVISYTGSPYCQNAGTATVTQTGTTGGTYTSITGLTINAATGTITLGTSTPGTYTVTYTIPAAGGCAQFSTNASVTVTATPNATISYTGSPYCQSAGVATVNQTGTTGGIYSSTAGLTLNTSTGAITPATSTPGTYTVTYTIPANGGCALFSTTTTVTITATPNAGISYTGTPYCQNAGTANVTQTGTTGGTYTSSAGLTINAATGAVTPGTSTPGTYTVTYTIAASGGCGQFTTTTTISITATPNATINYSGSPYCQNASTATVTQTGTTGGIYSAPAGLTINATNGTITPSSSTPGTYTVTYTIPAGGGCAMFSTSTSVSITATPTASISYTGTPYCQNAGTATVTRTGTAGGVYTSTGGLNINSSTGEINLGLSTAGTYTVTYTIAASGGCAAFSTTTSVVINSLSVTPTSATASTTSSCGPATVTLSVQGGSIGSGASWKWYSGSCGGTLVGTGATLNNVAVNNTTTFFVRAEGTCNTTACASVTVTINPQPTISLSAAPYTSLLPGLTTTITATINPSLPTNFIVWYRNNTVVPGANGNTLNVTVDQLGSYTATVTTAANCTATSAALVIADSAVNKLFISPNPNNGQFKVRYYTPATNFGFLRMLTIIDSKGAQVYSESFPITGPYSSMDVDIRRTGKGTYFVILSDYLGKTIATGKVQVL